MIRTDLLDIEAQINVIRELTFETTDRLYRIAGSRSARDDELIAAIELQRVADQLGSVQELLEPHGGRNQPG